MNQEFLAAEIEHFFTCPVCWAEISMLLDLSISRQQYVEDCEVCCHPLMISYTAVNHTLTAFNATSES